MMHKKYTLTDFVKRNDKAIFMMALILTSTFILFAQQKNNDKKEAYLFTYFTGNGKSAEAIRFAISGDGYNYRALNKNNPVLDPETISATGGVRDPHILRGADGKTFYMVATDMQVAKYGWGPNYGMVLLKSTDLVNWTSHIVNIPQNFPEFEKINRVWAPQTIYDVKTGKYMLYWSMRIGEGPDIIYYAYANKDFTGLENTPKQLFFSPTNNACIDGDIIYKDGKYNLFFKTEGTGKGIKKAVSAQLTSGYVQQEQYLQQTKDPVEGAGVFKLNKGDDYILMYDVYTKGRYQFTKSKDLENFTVIDQEVTMDFHPRHGTVLPITRKEAEGLLKKWYSPEDLMGSARSPVIKNNNIVMDTVLSKLYLPVKNGTDLKSFDPGFISLPGTSVSPLGARDFTKGPVSYAINFPGNKTKTFQVSAAINNNPVLDGYYADPEILYANKTGKYYLYPTSDGFAGWGGTYFKAFSSPDLLNWKDEGTILDLPKDVKWAVKNAWAPTIAEKKINGVYKYFYYFTAAQKIGVAVADDPIGPFKPMETPLIARKPSGINRGQEIDPDVFTDPKTGKSFLYWGNGYMAGVMLSDDMTAIDTAGIKIITPDATFREGTEVFYRNGKYYFLWSENDTRSEDYRVRYGVAESPLGKITVPENNLVLAKDTTKGIYGTGHNSVIQVPGTDRWYIVYHRFTRPKGITMGASAGYNREVCIDILEFEADGQIKRVVPTLTGLTSKP
jgi:arabinoxylan arabinofuranohydrolase